MLEPDAKSGRPPGGPGPPAPPATGNPGGRPNPADRGPAITVRLDEFLLGDLGNPAVDAQLLSAVLLRDGQVARWLRSRGVDADAIERSFPGSGWA